MAAAAAATLPRRSALAASAVSGEAPPAGPRWLRGLVPVSPSALSFEGRGSRAGEGGRPPEEGRRAAQAARDHGFGAETIALELEHVSTHSTRFASNVRKEAGSLDNRVTGPHTQKGAANTPCGLAQ